MPAQVYTPFTKSPFAVATHGLATDKRAFVISQALLNIIEFIINNIKLYIDIIDLCDNIIAGTANKTKGVIAMATNDMPQKCPSCGRGMRIRLMKCSSCDTEIQGDFDPGRFSGLSDEQLDFLEIFVRSRGNLKDVGSLLGISYPTARNRLDGLISALESRDRQKASFKRMEILEMVKAGGVTVDEALELLGGK